MCCINWLITCSETIWIGDTFAKFRPSGGWKMTPIPMWPDHYLEYWSLNPLHTWCMHWLSLQKWVDIWPRWPFFALWWPKNGSNRWLSTVIGNTHHWIHFILVGVVFRNDSIFCRIGQISALWWPNQERIDEIWLSECSQCCILRFYGTHVR